MAEDQQWSYGGKFLRVDLTEGRVWHEQLNEEAYREWLGGVGYGAKVLYEEVPPGLQWSDPANRLVVASGPLGGTRINGSGTVSVTTKGPMTNGVAASQANGFQGALMRPNGFDGVVFQGAAQSLKHLYIHEGEAGLRNAESLAGVDAWDMIDRLAEELALDVGQLSVFGIGPAGETLVRFAALVGDRGHVAGHNGIGAVMGSKRLKAIVAKRAPGVVSVHDREALAEVARSFFRCIADSPAGREGIMRWGTLRLLAHNVRGGTGLLPVKNYTTSVYNIPPAVLETWDGPYL
jgi:aldehyde:ferredoxin oxidoreductase